MIGDFLGHWISDHTQQYFIYNILYTIYTYYFKRILFLFYVTSCLVPFRYNLISALCPFSHIRKGIYKEKHYILLLLTRCPVKIRARKYCQRFSTLFLSTLKQRQ